MVKKKRRAFAQGARRWLFWGVAGFAIVWMAYDVLLSDHGYLTYRSEKAELERMRTEIAELKAKREKLAKEVLRLRNDPKALEELVHRELGYVHPDEYMLIIPEEKSPLKENDKHD